MADVRLGLGRSALCVIHTITKYCKFKSCDHVAMRRIFTDFFSSFLQQIFSGLRVYSMQKTKTIKYDHKFTRIFPDIIIFKLKHMRKSIVGWKWD